MEGTSGEPRDPAQLRRDIEETRAELGATVEALSHKTDVKERLAEGLSARAEAVRERAGEVRESAAGATPEDAKRAAAQLAHATERRPLPAIAAAFTAGVLAGWLVARR